MKKTLFALLLVSVLVSGCLEVNLKSTVEDGVDDVAKRLGIELGIDEYALNEGDTATVDAKTIRLESFSSDYVLVFDIDGQKREMKETQDPQIVNGIELTITKFRYDPTDMQNNYVKVKIVKYVPALDEYLFYLEDEKTVLDHAVQLVGLDKDGTVTVTVDNVNRERIMEDKSIAIGDLYISNVRPNYRAIASERYVILKITSKP